MTGILPSICFGTQKSIIYARITKVRLVKFLNRLYRFYSFSVDMYLDFACCAAVPGGGRNKEYALHLLHMCGGNIHVNIVIRQTLRSSHGPFLQEAMIKLMQPTPFLPTDHPLLHYEYSDSDQWSATETESFHQAIQKHDKDFFKIAKDVSV